jgi:hypothetical protein
MASLKRRFNDDEMKSRCILSSSGHKTSLVIHFTPEHNSCTGLKKTILRGFASDQRDQQTSDIMIDFS